MDPASAAGLGIGVASLAFDAFDRSVKGQSYTMRAVHTFLTNVVFKFFSSMVDMPKDCERYRLQAGTCA
jgi:hypothetical protein